MKGEFVMARNYHKKGVSHIWREITLIVGIKLIYFLIYYMVLEIRFPMSMCIPTFIERLPNK